MPIPFRLFALSLWAGAFLSTAAQAVVLTLPVSTDRFADTSLPGTSLAARPELAGVALEDVVTPFHIDISPGGVGINGTVQSRVVRETATGTLDFYWKVSVTDAEGDLKVHDLRLDRFGFDALQDADWRSDSLGSATVNLARVFSASEVPSGGVNFLFNGDVAAGEQSRLFFLRTDATAYALSAGYDLQSSGPGRNSIFYATFAPATAVPEPSGLVMSGLGLQGLGRLARRQRRG
jgi:hypothetical protein